MTLIQHSRTGSLDVRVDMAPDRILLARQLTSVDDVDRAAFDESVDVRSKDVEQTLPSL